MTPQIDRLGKMLRLFWGFQHIYLVSKDIGGKTFTFQVNLGMWPLKLIVLEKWVTVLRVSTDIYLCFSRTNGKIVHFLTKPRHVTHQIDCLGKTNTVLRVSTLQLLWFPRDIGGKTFIFQGKPRHVTPQIDHLGKTNTVLRVSTHIYGVSQEIDGKPSSFLE